MTELQKAVSEDVGKPLAGAMYLQPSSIRQLPMNLRLKIARALRVAGDMPYQVIQINKDGCSISLLQCHDFEKQLKPKINYSVRVFLSAGNFCVSNYTRDEHPPIFDKKLLEPSISGEC